MVPGQYLLATCLHEDVNIDNSSQQLHENIRKQELPGKTSTGNIKKSNKLGRDTKLRKLLYPTRSMLIHSQLYNSHDSFV